MQTCRFNIKQINYSRKDRRIQKGFIFYGRGKLVLTGRKFCSSWAYLLLFDVMKAIYSMYEEKSGYRPAVWTWTTIRSRSGSNSHTSWYKIILNYMCSFKDTEAVVYEWHWNKPIFILIHNAIIISERGYHLRLSVKFNIKENVW